MIIALVIWGIGVWGILGYIINGVNCMRKFGNGLKESIEKVDSPFVYTI